MNWIEQLMRQMLLFSLSFYLGPRFATGDIWTSEAPKCIWTLEPQLKMDKCICISILKIPKQVTSIFKEICFKAHFSIKNSQIVVICVELILLL